MKSLLFLPLAFFVFIACNQAPQTPQMTPDTPKALQDNDSKEFLGSYSKRGYSEDLVRSLYDELVTKTPELKEIEIRTNYLYQAKIDSVYNFNYYDQKNNSYYTTAEEYTNRISDSVLADKIRSLIIKSQSAYATETKKHKDLIKLLDSNAVKIQDLYTVLKLVKTLPLIEKYQKDNLPNSNSINRVVGEQNKAIRKLDSLVSW